MSAPEANAPVPFPLQLERVVFTRFVVAAIPEHDPPESGHSLVDLPQNKVDVGKDPEQPRTYVVTMRTLVNPTKSKVDPYFIDVECLAVFVADEKLSEEEARRGVLITGHNVAYGAIREAVAWMTGRQPYGSLILGLSVLTPKPRANAESAQVAPEPKRLDS